MNAAAVRLAAVLGVCLLLGCCLAKGPYDWAGYDAFDEIMEKMGQVNEHNCKELSVSSLRLPENSIGQIPRFNVLPQIVIFPNRTNLIHMHNMALNRAYFYSYILQRLNTSDVDFPLLPGALYYYLGAAADVSSSIGLMNGSGVLFDTHCQYANWFPRLLLFNKTLPLFGPSAYLLDDFSDPVNWLREPTNNTIVVDDLGAGADSNYTARWHRLYPQVISDIGAGIDFIPDAGDNYQRKHQYDFTIYHAAKVGEMEKTPAIKRKFFGPPSPGTSENYQPVYFSRPYFDCGRSNKWIVSSVGPVIDFMRRYSEWIKLRKPQYVATTVTELDFLRVDFDPCERPQGSQDRTYFSGTARCRSTTLCEPLPGFGFHRGGYMCHCRPGYRYPYWQNGPFMGKEMEQASEEEAGRFECIPVDWKMRRLTERGIVPNSQRRRKRSAAEIGELSSLMRVYNVSSVRQLRDSVRRHDFEDRRMAEQLRRPSLLTKAKRLLRSTVDTVAGSLSPSSSSPTQRRQRRSISTSADYGDQSIFYLGRLGAFDTQRYQRAKDVIAWKMSVTADNCAANPLDRLQLPGEAGYGADESFQVQARAALRLSHFVSAFSQIVNPDERYGGMQSDGYLNRDQLFGEVFAAVMSDQWIRSAGIYFDREAFWDPASKQTMEYFGPTAFKESSDSQTEQRQRELSFVAEDAGGWPQWRAYHRAEWFRTLKERWASNTYGLEQFTTNPYLRTDVNGTHSDPYQRFPLYFRAPRIADLHWTPPYFDCNRDRDPNRRHTNAWVMTVAAPFFGFSQQGTLQFMGAATVTVPLEKLDIRQCPSSFYEANLFKSTAPCHYETSFCVPVIRNEFKLGNFKCECRQGYEYAFDDKTIWFYAGGTVLEHYELSMRNERNYYRLLQCREAGAAWLLGNMATTLGLAAAAFGVVRF